MRNKLGTCCMIMGTVLMLGALSLFLFNRYQARRAQEAAEQLLPLIKQKTAQISEERALREQTEEGDAFENTDADPGASAMRSVEIEGYDYIGCLFLPSLELELPVMSQWDYGRLKIAPCRYYGSAKTDDLVIAAHNYDRHFGKLSKLAPGDRVYFTDMEGEVSSYTVTELAILAPAAVEEMTGGEYDLTLFTCTYGGKNRIAVHCDRTEE